MENTEQYKPPRIINVEKNLFTIALNKNFTFDLKITNGSELKWLAFITNMQSGNPCKLKIYSYTLTITDNSELQIEIPTNFINSTIVFSIDEDIKEVFKNIAEILSENILKCK
jgi:hypothetical protein